MDDVGDRERAGVDLAPLPDAGGGGSPDRKVVALVASAGGLDALSRVLAPLPASFPAPVVALQHLSPDHPSHLAAILDRRTPLSVVAAEDGDRMEPGRVYVAPPARHLLIGPDEVLRLILSGNLPPARPSADLLLLSLALSCGSRAVAVVLSGRGNDGAAGVTAVKRFGGTVLVQDRATAREFGMAEAALAVDSVVDEVLSLEGIGPALAQLVHP